jgi:predicted regulator of Ras-like GTPase activity (Roadblock/LC7/MglB family)
MYYELALKRNSENMEALRELEKLMPDFALPPEVAKARPAPPETEGIEETPLAVPMITKPDMAGVAPEPKEPDVVEKVDETEIVTTESVLQETPEKEPVIEPVPLAALDKPIKRLLDIDTVKGVFISTKDGLLIKNYGKADSDVETICASVAAICLDVDESFRLLKRGGLTRCIIEKPDETLCIMTAGESLLTVITKVEAKPGLVFVYARKIIEEIKEILE